MNVDKTGGTKLPTSFTYTLSAQVYVNRRPCTDAESATKHPLPRSAKPAAGEGWGGGKPNRFTTNIEAPAENVGHKYTIHKVPLSSELICWVSSMRDKNSLRKQESRLFPNPPAETKHALLPPPQPSPAADADASCEGGRISVTRSPFTYTLSAQVYVKLLLTLTLALLTAPAFAAPDFKPLETGGSYAQLYQQNVRYGVYQADPARVSLHWKATDGSAYATLGTLKRHLEASGARVAFLMNAGIYSTDDTPAGLWIERGKTLIPLNRKAGKGNFHIQPNGVFYIEGGKARIQPTAAYQLGQHQPEWALQSGPMLLIDGKPNARFVKNLSSPHKRNAVCTTADNRLYFILTEDYDLGSEWPSFHRFAEALQHLGCHDALYLDGTLSGWYIPGISGTFHWTHYVGIIAVTTPETP